MNLRDVLSLPEFSGKTPQECLDYGNTEQIISRNHTKYSYSGLGEIFEQANVDVSILIAMRTWIQSLVGGESLDAFLSCDGKCDFGLPGIQNYLSINLAIRENANDTHSVVALNAMINTGVRVGTIWDKYDTPTPNLDTINLAFEQISTQNDKEEFTQRYNSVIAKFESGEVTNLADAISAMSE